MMAQPCVGVQSWNKDEAGSRRPEAPAGFGKSQQLRQIRPLKTLKTLKNREENLGENPHPPINVDKCVSRLMNIRVHVHMCTFGPITGKRLID